jgi:hypothetical protein
MPDLMSYREALALRVRRSAYCNDAAVSHGDQSRVCAVEPAPMYQQPQIKCNDIEVYL